MRLLCFLLFYLSCITAQAQETAYTIVVLGSSTAEGTTGPTTLDSAWVYRYEDYLHEENEQHQVINLAKGTYTSYKIMPDEFLPPTGGGPQKLPDPERNITKALSYNPDAIIINLPSNDITSSFPLPDFTANLDSVKSMANHAGVLCFITTTQPRNATAYQKTQLIDMKDTILNRYQEFAINFWDSLANEDGSIKTVYNHDGTHFNNAGHKILSERTIAKDIPGFIEILPITLNYFRGSMTASGLVALNWETITENNNDYFAIERTKTKSQFKEIAHIKGAGNSTNRLQYQYIDRPPASGDWLYRLKQIDFDGTFTYSNIIQVRFAPPEAAVKAFPNPFKGKIKINITEKTDLTIYNMIGKEICSIKDYSGQELDLKSLEKGLYIFTYKTGEKVNALRVILQ